MELNSDGLSKSVKNKLKQGLSTFDLLTTVLAIAIVGGISAPILFKSEEVKDRSVASVELEKLSENLTKSILHEPSKNDNKEARMPSSAQITGMNGERKWEGLVGRDPWGQAYSYKVLRDAYGFPTHVLVWSKGPNGVQDTPDAELQVSDSGLNLRMDDLGHLREVF